MKKNFLIAMVALSLAALTALAACGKNDRVDTDTTNTDSIETGTESGSESETDTDATDTNTETESASETESTTDTESETESETAAPRYDYMEAEVLPDVTLDASLYTDMKLTLPADLQITDTDVDEYIEFIRFDYRVADNGSTQVKDKPLKLGDDAYIYYKGVINGEEFDGGSNWDDEAPYKLGIGSGSFIPGFETGLVGVIPQNATKEKPAEVKVTFPENYTSDLAGKEAVFYVAVEYSVQYTLPTYNREFVEKTLQYEAEKNFYASDKAYLDEFESFIRSYLESEIAQEVESARVDALWTYLTDKAICQNLPQMELDYYYNSFVSEADYYYNSYKNYEGFEEEFPTKDAFIVSFYGFDEGVDWKAEFQKKAERMVSRDMILHAIAEREGMETVTDEEYTAELDYWVDVYSGYMSKEDIEKNIGKDVLMESAFATKMQKWLLERATFSFETAAE